MNEDINNKLTVLALVFSIIALTLSGYGFSQGGAIGDDTAFQARLDKGIEAYIAKQQKGGAPAAPTGPIDVSIDDDAIKGDKNAPVTIVEFSDYECPFCERFYKNTLPELISEYIDTGKARLVYRDFPLSFHENARPAAMAAECVRDQKGDEAYFALHDKIFDNQSSLSVDSLKNWALEIGVNESKYTDCVESEKFGAEIDKDFQEGQAYGVTGTPAFFVNGRKLSGAQPFSAFKALIEEELAK
jgi:protein-disulfide isomerase